MKLFAACSAVLFVAALIFVTQAPAQAALTAAMTATTPSYTGACPTTMAFTGSISGPPGTAFQYSFNRYINGVQQVQNVGAATLPASGTLAVGDSFSIGSTSSGVNFDQIWVHNIAGGQSDVYSNRAAFSVTCSSGAPPPSGIGKFGVTGIRSDPDDKAHNPAAPVDISTSVDPKACATHIANPLVAGLLCQPIARANKLFIVWNWQPHGCFSCPQDVDGFKVYLTDAGMTTRTYLTQTSAGAGATVSVLDLPAGGFVGKCYSVTSYKGAKESSLGQRTCISAAPALGSIVVTLTPAHLRSVDNAKAKCSDCLRIDGITSTDGGSEVGFDYTTIISIYGDTSQNFIDRAGVMFDLGSLAGRPLQNAILRMHVDTKIGSRLATHDNSRSCLAELGTGRGAWWTNAGWIEADWTRSLPGTGPDVVVDVTNEVRAWMNGAPNFGFVFRGPSEDLSIFSSDSCETTFTATLTVEHF